jgi:RNA polymerase sigma factor (sigma-70 family)
MPLETDDIKEVIEKALQALSERGSAELAGSLRPILYTNLDRKRIQVSIEGDRERIFEYVQLVADKFQLLSPILYEIQVARSDKLWEPLLERMRKWAYNFLKRTSYNVNMVTSDNAMDCAAEASITLLNAYFPYDVDLDPWMHVIVQHTCQKFIRKNKGPAAHEESLDDIQDFLDKIRDPSSLDKERQRELLQILLEAMDKLNETRREIIELMYFQGLSPKEIAEKTGKSAGAIHSLHFNALRDLRKILSGKGDNLNE